MENLPEEMMIQILSRLPSESLFQFKYVSKFWNAVINDPENSSHLQHKYILFERFLIDDESGKTQLILSTLRLDPSMSLFDDFLLPLDWNKSPWPFPFEFDGSPIPFDDDPDYYKNFYVQNHSHGLVCITKLGEDIILCNPSTREIRKLPPSIIALSDPLNYLYGRNGNAVGFGYDPKSRDFKVVRLVCFHPTCYYLKGEIFDLSKGRWREIIVPYMLGVTINPSFGLYHEGTYYWARSTHGRPFIHSFDLSEEVFDQIWLPESVERWCSMDQIEMLNGSIVIFHYSQQEDEYGMPLDVWKMDKLDIWKMGKDDKIDEISWSIIFTIDLLCGIDRAMMFVNTDQLLISKEGQLGLFNIKTQQFKEFREDNSYWTYSTRYFVKSLLSVKGSYGIK